MRKKQLLAVLTAFLLLTGCSMQSESSTSGVSLTEAQKSFLRSQGLSDDAAQLSVSQIRNVQRIDEMMQYLTEKYDETFVYLEYHAPELLQSEKLFACPLNSDGMTNTITVRPDGANGFTDDYVPITSAEGVFGSEPAWQYVQAQMQDFVKNYAKKNNLGETVLYISEVFPTEIRNMNQVQEQEDGTEDFCWKFSCSATCFVYEDNCSRSELEEMAKAFAEWDYDRHIMAQMRFQTLYDTSIDMTEITAANMADYYKVGRAVPSYYMYCVNIFDNRIHDYDNETANGFDYTHEEYFNGGRASKWFPVHVTDIQYQGETVIDKMTWYTAENAYLMREEAEKGSLYFPEINKLLKKAGWEYQTDSQSYFGWKKNGRSVIVYIEDSDELDRYGVPKKTRSLEVNGELTDMPFSCSIFGREYIPKYQHGEFLVELFFSVESYKELFGIIIEIDQNSADINHPNATGTVTAIDSY